MGIAPGLASFVPGCREAVASCCGTQSVAATPPESTTAEPDFVYAGVVEVQHVQPKSKRRKGLAGRVRSWVQKRRRKKICPTANEAPLQDQKKTLKRRENLKETSPDIEKHVTQYCHRAVQVPQDLSLEHIKDDEPPRDVKKPTVWCYRRPVETPHDLILEDIEDEELPRDEEKPAVSCHRRPVEVPQDLILEDIEDEELPRDEEKPAVSCHRRPVEVLQDLILEDIEDEELPRDEEKPAVSCHRRPVEVLQDLILEDIEDEELPRDEEKPAVSCHRRPVEVPQDLILEDIEEELPRDEEKPAVSCHRRPLEIILEDDEDEDLPRDVDSVTAPNDLPPPEDCRSPKCEEDGEGSSLAVDGMYPQVAHLLWNKLAVFHILGSEWILENLNSEEDTFPVSSSDLASTVSQTEEEDLEEENLYVRLLCLLKKFRFCDFFSINLDMKI
uniref:uncharacterized protein LOC128928120 n=1 Tax=Callithrix jacchus TaxID=9483 RepID=UPI0023DD5720|nr:uncharacterized protein LOC128928120 [Callithrix jacchus]